MTKNEPFARKSNERIPSPDILRYFLLPVDYSKCNTCITCLTCLTWPLTVQVRLRLSTFSRLSLNTLLGYWLRNTFSFLLYCEMSTVQKYSNYLTKQDSRNKTVYLCKIQCLFWGKVPGSNPASPTMILGAAKSLCYTLKISG